MSFATKGLSSCFLHITFAFFCFPSFSSKWGKHYLPLLGVEEVVSRTVWISEIQEDWERVCRWVCGHQTIIVRAE